MSSPSSSLSSADLPSKGTKPKPKPSDHNLQYPHHAPLTPRKSSSDLTSTTTTPYPTTQIPTSHLPPTPETTPHLSTRTLKRPLPTDVEDSPSKDRQIKRRKSSPESNTTITASPKASKYLFPPPSPNTNSSTLTPRPLFKKPAFDSNKKVRRLAAVELKRASEAMLLQIDWLDVAAYVACNRKGVVYKNAVKDVLQRAVDGLFEEERRKEGESEG